MPARRHGRSRTPIHDIWQQMLARCSNPRRSRWSSYGGRGIVVCERWKVFENFLADMGERPAGKSLDRIDNDGPYAPENCRWATPREQYRNRRQTILITHLGETMCRKDWCLRLGLDEATVAYRMRVGWSTAKALTPGRQYARSKRVDKR